MTTMPTPDQPDQGPIDWDKALKDHLDKNPHLNEQTKKLSTGETNQYLDSSRGIADPVYAPITHLIPPPDDRPDYNKPADENNPYSVDIYLESRQILPQNRIDPNVIVPARDVFTKWAEKLSAGIEAELLKQELPGEKIEELSALGKKLATSAYTTVQQRTLTDNLDGAWVPAKPVVAVDQLMTDEMGTRLYTTFYDAAVSQKRKIQLLRQTNQDNGHDQEIADEENKYLLGSSVFMSEDMRARDEHKLRELNAERNELLKFAEPGYGEEKISLAFAQITLLKTEIAGAWPSQQRRDTESNLSSLQSVRSELEEFRDNPEKLSTRINDVSSNITHFQSQQQQDGQDRSSWIKEQQTRLEYLQKIAEPVVLDQEIEKYTRQVSELSDALSKQPSPITVSGNTEKIDILEQNVQRYQTFMDEVGRNLAITDVDQQADIIRERLTLPEKMNTEIPALIKTQALQEENGDFDGFYKTSARLETWQQVQARLQDEQANPDNLEAREKHASELATKAGKHRHLMVSAGTALDGGFIEMLGDGGFSKSTIKWGAELLTEAIAESPQYAPRPGFPVPGLRPADDLLPANRIGEIFTASRNLPWDDQAVPDAFKKNGDKVVNLDTALANSISLLSEKQDDAEENNRRLALGKFLLRNSFAIRRIANEWIQDGHIPGWRDERIDPASEMLLGMHVRSQDIGRAIDAVFTQGVTSTVTKYNPDQLNDNKAEPIIGSESYALKPESVEILQQSLAIATRRLAANEPVTPDNNSGLVAMIPKYAKGSEKLFMERGPERPKATPEILDPNQQKPITGITLTLGPSLLEQGLVITAEKQPDTGVVDINIVTKSDVEGYRQRKASNNQKPAPQPKLA